jgi:signal recognition particle subunit SRP54
MREIRQALLAADVSYKVVKDFVARVAEKAVGEQVVKSVSPGQQVVKIVHDALVDLMGPVDHSIRWAVKGPTVILMAGLQGTGKTTTCAKLARFFEKRGKHPLLVAADVKRPAAIDQLKTLGAQLGLPVYAEEGGRPPMICKRAVAEAATTGRDVVILDTAGRLAIDREMMDEVKAVAEKVTPDEIFLVCDAMTGQDAVNSAKAFNDELSLTGVILTKLDGDARGGAAMSVKEVTGKPIKFAGVGEKVEDFEEFHPDRMAGRILGMGDIVSLVEKAQEVVDQEEVQKRAEALFTGTFTMEDFLGLFDQMKKLGPMKQVLEQAGPGFAQLTEGMSAEEMEDQMVHTRAMILSMTPEERFQPEVIDHPRRRRIARGSGTSLDEVNQLLKEFKHTRKMFKQIGQQGGFGGFLVRRGFRKRKMRQLKDMKKQGGIPFSLPGMPGGLAPGRGDQD